MEKWYSRFKRGDVWFLHFSNEKGDGLDDSSVQKKSRPYLIVSCEENNLNAPTFNVLPISTRDNDHLPMHVYYRYQESANIGRNQTIFCEQITTVSVLIFNDDKSRYMYSLSVELMNKVDEALTRQLGLKPRVADMQVLERLVHEAAETERARIEAEKQKYATMRMEKLAEYLAKTFNLNITTDILQNGTEYRDAELQMVDKQTVKEMRETAKERKSVKTRTESDKPEMQITQDTKAETKPKSKRSKWSDEAKKQFLQDYKCLTIAQMSEKYGIKKSSVAYNACVFKKDVATT